MQTHSTDADKTLTLIVYILYAFSAFAGIAALIAVIINYVKKPDVAGTYLDSHFDWQIRTFWFALLWAVIGIITVFFYIGVLILFLDWVWCIYRVVKGLIRLSENRPMYAG